MASQRAWLAALLQAGAEQWGRGGEPTGHPLLGVHVSMAGAAAKGQEIPRAALTAQC